MLAFSISTTVSNILQMDPAILSAVAFGLAIAFWISFVFSLRMFLNRRSRLRRKGIELTTLLISLPKYKTEEEAKKHTAQEIQEGVAAAEIVFSSIAGRKAQKGIFYWLMGRKDEIAFEIVVSKKVIKFYTSVPKKLIEYVRQQILSQYPTANMEEVEDYNIFSANGVAVGGYLTFKRPVGFPIKTYKKFEHDPLNSITNAISGLGDGEGAAIQLVVRSAPGKWRTNGLHIVKRMKQESMRLEEALHPQKFKGWIAPFKSKEANEKDQAKTSQLPRHSPLEEEAMKGIEEKASKPAMDANIRIVVSTAEKARSYQILQDILSGFAQYNIYEFGNAFVKNLPIRRSRLFRDLIYRTFSDKHKIILNSEEIASIWHLPMPWTETPNIHWLRARHGSAPVIVPQDEGVLLGVNEYRGVKREIRILRPDRQRHMYIIGKSGSGKTVFMQEMAVQDINNGEGVCVVDPHGDMIEYILGRIPKDRVDDVIVFSPSDMDRPVGLNMLEAKDPAMKDFAVQEMISIFYKLFPPEMIGPMFEHNMRNVMLTLMSDNENPGTLAEIPRMFTDEDYQKKWVAKLTDPVVLSFWQNEMAKTSDFHKSEMLGYLISKVGRFVENEMMRNIIGQSHSGFDFREVMDNKKILLVNLSKGLTGEVNANLLGLIIVSKLQMAALSRANLPEEQRHDFYLYIDEFQNFITDSIATILSEARKYRLNLIIGHQYMGQLVKDNDTKVRDAVLGNVGSTFVSRIGPEDTEILEKLYQPYFAAYDLINSDKYTWYVKMIVENSQVNPFTMRTLSPGKSNTKLADAIKQLSRLKYGRDKSIVDSEIMERAQLGERSASQPPEVGVPSL